ncbi:MAG: thiamine-phosphate kinase [Candidatus Ranarchaeia archaeon]
MSSQQKINELGEYALIERIRRMIDHDPSTPLGFGDDATAFIIKDSDNLVIANSDMFVGSTDIPPGMSYTEVGSKVVTMAVSDLAAKGLPPRAFLLSMGLPADFYVSDFDSIILGVNTAIRRYGGWFLGGDINQANDLVLDGIAIGSGSRVISRIGMKPGDIIAVTGEFGLTAAGLDLLLKHRNVGPSIRKPLIDAVYEPCAAVKVGCLLAKEPGLASMIDSSDGLARSLHLLAAANNIGIEVHRVPIASAAQRYATLFSLDPDELALYGGEEFHLVFACRPASWTKLARRFPALFMIGKATEKKQIIFSDEEKDISFQIEDRGWEHFTQ